MKKLTTYLPSFLVSLLLIFSCLCSTALIIVDLNVTADKVNSFTEKKNISSKVIPQLDRYYREKQNVSGIPAKLYMDSLDEEYIKSVIKCYINEGFEVLENGGNFYPEIPKNDKLESSIEKFFVDYADETGYEKDDTFYRKLEATKNSAYENIGSSCDVYKFSSINKSGVLKKASKAYKLRGMLTLLSVGFSFILLALMFLIDFREKKVLLYWSGVSLSVAGILGAVPTLYLIKTKYFNAFSIKQPQVFTAYTGLMFKLTEAFAASSIAILAAGIVMIVLYCVLGRGTRSESKKVKPLPETETVPETKNEAENASEK